MNEIITGIKVAVILVLIYLSYKVWSSDNENE